MFLDIQFPLPAQFPKPYLRLQDVMSNLDDELPKPNERTHDSVKDPKNTLAYIITNFNIGKVSPSICTSGYPWSDPIRLNNFSLALSLIGFLAYGLPGTIGFVLGQNLWGDPVCQISQM